MTLPNFVEMRLDDVPPVAMTKMPYLTSKTLAEDWVRFPNMRFDFSECNPYRVAAWTGRQARKTLVRTTGPLLSGDTYDWQAANGWLNTVPYWLNRLGYNTASIGKHLNGYPWDQGDFHRPAGWDRMFCFLGDSALGGAHATHKGPQYYTYVCNIDGTLVTRGTNDSWGSSAVGYTSAAKANRSADTDYSTDFMNLKARDFVSSMARTPWYLHIGTRATHRNDGTVTSGNTVNNMDPANRHIAASVGAASRPGSFNEDSRRVADATFVAGSNIVTSPTIAFAGGDVGATVSAPAAGVPANTTIVSVQSGTQATLSANATTSITGTGVLVVLNGLGFSATHPNRKPAWLRDQVPTQLSVSEATALDGQQLRTWRTMLAADELLYDLEQTLRGISHPDGGSQWDHTVVFVNSDNGGEEGQHRLGSQNAVFNLKLVPYEESMRTEMWVHWPGASTTRSSLTEYAPVTTTDLAPTIMEMANASRSATLPTDGMSFLPLLDGRVATVGGAGFRSMVFSEWVNPGAAYGADSGRNLPSWTGVVEFGGNPYAPARKHIEYLSDSSPSYPAENEDYDLVADPDELVNLARTAPYTDLATALAKMRRM